MYKKLLIILFFVFWAMPALGDVDTAWVRRYNGPDDFIDEAHAIAVDDSGNVYVTGESYSSDTHFDYTTIKYYPNGDTAWVRRYNGPGNRIDYACALAVDDSGNVYVTGYSDGNGTYVDYATIKYDSYGNELWARRYDGLANSFDGAEAIAVDAFGYVYVTGKSVGDSLTVQWDYATVKYRPTGDTVWVRRYCGPGYWNEAVAIAVDDFGNVYVTGMSAATGGIDYEYATVKYDSLGTQLWVGRYNGTGDYQDFAKAVVVDDSGNVYVTGQGWEAKSGEEFATVKYDVNGIELWVRRYHGTGNGFNRAYDIGMDDFGNIYVTGISYATETKSDYATIKYLPNGDTAWVRRYDNQENVWDEVYSLAVQGCGDIYVVGTSGTIKYDTDGNLLWVGLWGGVDIILDGSNNVCVVGNDVSTGASDYLTVKYVQTGTDIMDETAEREKPSAFTLSQNYPNPFNQTTKIEFTLAKSGVVSLNIYDILGRKVRTLVSEHLSSGYKSVLWDGKNDSGKDVASGIYFYQLKVGDFSETKKLVLLK
jgi:hypothetical protein